MPPVVVTRIRKPESLPQALPFQPGMIPDVEGVADFLRDYRARAWEVYERFPLPTTADEAWRRTDIHGLADLSLVPAFKPEQNSFFYSTQLQDKTVMSERLRGIPDDLLTPLTGESHGGQMILTPSGAITSLDPALAAQGVIFTDLLTAEYKHPDILANILGQVVRADEGKFAALAAALSIQGALVYVPHNVQVEQPLHSLLWGPGGGKAYFTHILVWVEEGGSLTYVHEAASPTEEKASLHAGIVEIHMGQGANLHFVELQSWGEHIWNFSHERARVSRDANLDWIFGAVGSKLTKNFSELDLVGDGATGRMSGFYFTDGSQHLDHDTQQNHLAPHTTSDLLFKGALKDQSRSVWQGMIYVAPEAMKTDGYQANRNLLLSSKARADSIPGLEILADDVRCTHGATVGKIDPEQVFYLRSRGIPYGEAERLIVEGFFDPIMQRIPFDGVRSRFQEAIEAKIR
jgi:Fe-S cluster assembly protein SufD